MKSRKSIFVSGIGKRNALMKLLKKEAASHDVGIAGADAQIFPPAKCEVDVFYQLPKASEKNFIDAYAGMLKEANAHGHLTLVDPEIPILGDMEDSHLTGFSRLLHPSGPSARLCEDKLAFALKMEQNSISSIPTFLAPISTGRFICKDRKGSAASGFHVFDSIKDFQKNQPIKKEADLIFQPYCSGVHHCVDAYFALADGRLIDGCVKRVLNKANGESYLLESVAPTRFMEFINTISKVVPLRGIVNFDIYESGGELSVMEINCRIGGNYPASHAFGCNLLGHLFKEVFYADWISQPRFSEYRVGQYIAKYLEFTSPKEIKT